MPIESLTKLLLTSGLFEPFGLADGEAGFLDRPERDQLWESWHLQMDQLQQKIRIPSNMPIESLTKLLLTSGLFEPFGLADGEAGFLDRPERDQLWESWHLQMDQLQQKIQIPSNMPIESLTKLLLTSGLFETFGLADGEA